MKEYPWYCILKSNEPLQQGDFISFCPIIIPTINVRSKEIDTKVREYNVVVMSQSCDLIQGKVDLVLVCPIWTLKEIEDENDFYKSTRWKNILRHGYIPGYHLLNKCSLKEFEKDFVVVDFKNVYGVPFEFLKELIQREGKRLSLMSPYKEHLSQAFARFFMRVGLPIDIPEFKK
jgi:hypothetical protein